MLWPHGLIGWRARAMHLTKRGIPQGLELRIKLLLVPHQADSGASDQALMGTTSDVSSSLCWGTRGRG